MEMSKSDSVLVPVMKKLKKGMQFTFVRLKRLFLSGFEPPSVASSPRGVIFREPRVVTALPIIRAAIERGPSAPVNVSHE
jgi:hypothetical protein